MRRASRSSPRRAVSATGAGRSGRVRGLVALAAGLCLALPGAAVGAPDPPPPDANDFSCRPSAEHPRPVVLVHGLGATMRVNWSYLSPRLARAGYCVFALTYGVDPRTETWPYSPGGAVRMQKSSRELKRFVRRVRRKTGARRVDLVGHSEGTVMPRWYLERRGGAGRVRSFVALTPLWRGTNFAGAGWLAEGGEQSRLDRPFIDLFSSFCGSCPQFVTGSEYLDELNADGEAVPGIWHTNIVTRYDEFVVPYTSGLMADGGTNIILQRVCPLDLSEHNAVAVDPVVVQLVLNALDPAQAKRVRC